MSKHVVVACGGEIVFEECLFADLHDPIFDIDRSSNSLADVRSRSNGQLPDSIPPFDFNDCGDLALFFLLMRLKWYMQDTMTFGKVKARVFIDEGFKKNGIAIRIPTFEDAFAGEPGESIANT